MNRESRLQGKKLMVYTAASLLIGMDWGISVAVLWYAYDISAKVQAGTYTPTVAFDLLAEMGVIIVLITAAVWFVVLRFVSSNSWLAAAWAASWRTGVLLFGYVVLVLCRRELWRPSQGISDDAMFLPVVGRANAAFLSEFQWLIFVLEVIPLLACVSGLLCSLLYQSTRLSVDKADASKET